MPRNPTWLKDVPRILEALEKTDYPFVDRAGIESAFQLGPRQAARLAKKLGSHMAGGALVVPRQRIREYLIAAKRGREYRFEVRRVERVRDLLQLARRDVEARQVRFKVNPALQAVPDLPTGVRLGPGELHLAFKGLDDLLGQLFQLSQAIAGDFRKFEALIRPAAE